jgi:hypothetical protein
VEGSRRGFCRAFSFGKSFIAGLEQIPVDAEKQRTSNSRGEDKYGGSSLRSE